MKNIIKLGKKFNFKFACLPSNYLKLLKKNLINKSIKIKKIVSAASSLANKDKKILLKKINLYEMYGATRNRNCYKHNFNNNKSLVGSVGKILKNIDIKISDENNKFLN